jgi:hypothetical protein
MNYKLTIDINVLRTDSTPEGMETLQRWQTEGKIEIIEAEPPKSEKPTDYNFPGAPPKVVEADSRYPRGRGRPKKNLTSGPDFKGLSAILFPHRDPHKLNMTEINDIAHLMKHHGARNELFITINAKDFIDGGRRELLKASFGLLVMTPQEAVQMLTSLEGWK